ncbi:hypothetical protein LX32DRAFT_637539 [Colletotrichum zoysiae]|uniref:Uncharacterized protein n=1 Tax=Colletotrichum zoysiae TaxID=1216348 RepID=A0AAD9M3Y0_9PEZI|nr:hypothetical protein LX32DRAFT_637539 [Colletotrichum zoysiae]
MPLQRSFSKIIAEAHRQDFEKRRKPIETDTEKLEEAGGMASDDDDDDDDEDDDGHHEVPGGDGSDDVSDDDDDEEDSMDIREAQSLVHEHGDGGPVHR